LSGSGYDISSDATVIKLHGTAAVLPGGHLAIGGVDVVELAREFGTPLWVLDEAHFRENCRAFRRAFCPERFPAGAEVVYAGKALLTRAVCRLVALEGLSLDVVSGGELWTALGAGVPPDRIYFHGNNKTEEELKLALRAGVGRVVVDSLDELELLTALAEQAGAGRPGGNRRVGVLLRVTPGVEVATHDHIRTGQVGSKFGLDLGSEQALEAVRRCLDQPGLELRGLHCHLGSQVREVHPYAEAAEVLLELAAASREATGWTPDELSLGGGFAVRYRVADEPVPAVEDYAEAIARVVTRVAAQLRLPVPKVLVEPGRAIAATAGWTLYTVGVVKEVPGIATYVAVDGGMADNPRPALYGARYEAALASRVSSPPDGVFTVVGRCCETGDILVRDVSLPKPVRGDVLVVSCTGAYNFSMASNYNRLPRPAMVLVCDGRAELVVRRQTYADLDAFEELPDRLKGLEDP